MNALVTILYVAGVGATILALAFLTFVTVRRQEAAAESEHPDGESWTSDRLLHDLMWWQ